MVTKIFPIVTKPGIQRDGTSLASNFYNDGQHCRFQRSLPRKMGGYKQLIGTLLNVPRGLFVLPTSPNFNVYVGDNASLQYLSIDQDGNVLGPLVDRTPPGFPVNTDNVWQFDEIRSSTGGFNALIAHAAPSLSDIASTLQSPVYYGASNLSTPLLPTGTSVSGGVLVLHPYLFFLDKNGFLQWSNENDPTTILDSAYVTAQNLIVGKRTRGGNSNPSGLIWSLNSVIRVTNVSGTGTPTFRFDTITDESSILSSRSVIEYDGLFYWAGIDHFLVYNGTVRDLPNSMSQNYFFTNLNYAQRQKVWATKVPEFGEIWWYYPSGVNTECDRAVIFNVRENTWYDTLLPRGCGYFEQVFADPIWADSLALSGAYSLWIHERGVDVDVNGTLSPIQSYFETSDIAFSAVGPDGNFTGNSRWVSLDRVEPDLIQSGDMTLTVSGRKYARSPVASDAPITFSPTTEHIDTRVQRRFMTLRFESNTVGGDYQMGATLLNISVGDARQ